MTSKQKWPNNWEYHILQYCDFYFSGKDIKYVDKKFWKKSMPDYTRLDSLNLRFEIGGHHYLTSIDHNDGHFSCYIFYRKLIKWGDENFDLAVLDDIAGFGAYNSSTTDLMDFAEQAMWEDYNRREGNDWDNDDDGEDSPIEPYSPCGCERARTNPLIIL